MVKESEALWLVVIGVVIASLGQIFLKNAMRNIEIPEVIDLINIKTLFQIFTNNYIIFGLILYAFATLLWLGSLSKLDVSIAYPLVSLGYIVTAIIAFFFLQEKITLIQWFGIFLIIIGSITITKF